MWLLTLISVVVLTFSLTVQNSIADIYKYVDKNGVTHFTNIRPSSDYARVIKEKNTASSSQYDPIIHKKSSKYNIEPAIIKAVITAESNWDPRAVSHKGAIGLMQLMPSTASDMNVSNPFNPEENIDGGTKYLSQMLRRFRGNLDLALAAYNAGPSRVEREGGIPSIRETRMFVHSVKSFYKGFSEKKKTQIFKVIYSDGTVLYTNTPLSQYQQEL